MGMAGFEVAPKNDRNEHQDYLGKAVSFANQWAGVIGIYLGTERDNHGVDYAIFNPSIVYSAANRAFVSNSSNSKLVMPAVVVRPIIGTLEEWVNAYNAETEKKDLQKVN